MGARNTAQIILRIGSAVGLCAVSSGAYATSPARPSANVTSPTEARLDLRLTVYQTGRAFVRERRKVMLEPGRTDLQLQGIPDGTLTESVIAKVSKGKPAKILEQRFRYDLMSPRQLWKASVGQQVVLDVPSEHTGKLVPVPAQVLSASGAGQVVRTSEGITFRLGQERARFAKVPTGLLARPTLTWTVEAAEPGLRTFDMSYMMRGISWQAAYVATLSRDQRFMQLQGWVTMTNNTSVKLVDASIGVVAGRVHQVQGVIDGLYRAAAAERSNRVERLGHVLLFHLPGKTTLQPHEVKLVRLLTLPRVRVDHRWETNLRFSPYRSSPAQTKRAVHVLLATNSKVRGAGEALPGGSVRVMAPDRHGTPQLVATAYAADTPEDEPWRVQLGAAPDVTVRLIPKSERRFFGSRTATYTLTARNDSHKGGTLRINLQGAGNALEIKGGKATRPDASVWRLQVPMAPGQKKTWTVTVRRAAR